MIPLTRRSSSLARLSSSLVFSCSRQALPRPARLHSSAPKRDDASTHATASSLSPSDYPVYMLPLSGSNATYTPEQSVDDMRRFLSRDQTYTILPTPLPEKEYSALDDMYFPESGMQDQVSIIDACLHNCHDVLRAKEVFERIGNDPRMATHITTKLCDAMLSAYVQMTVKDLQRSDVWVEDALALYEMLENGEKKLSPSANTYANMLLLWLRVERKETGSMPAMTTLVKPLTLLRRIVDREIPVTMVISDKAFTSSEDAADAMKLLSRAAVDANLPNLSKVIMELGTVEALGSQAGEGAETIPEVTPVVKQKKVRIPLTYRTMRQPNLKRAMLAVRQTSTLPVPNRSLCLKSHSTLRHFASISLMLF
jgi:DNA-directed RNA polymerase, mitochondrial